jgi:HK97 family phage prohead protease
MTAKTGEASTAPEPFGKPGGPGLWHHKGMQLPPYIQHVAHHLVAQGHDESKAIEMAVGIVRNWAEGHDGHGHKVHPDVQAAAAKNIAQWEADKAKAGKARRSSVTVTAERADAKKPYGDVPYADPGYLDADGNQASKSGKPGVKRYPLSPDKVMAAWSYINQKANAAQYTAEQLSAIKGRIRSAMAKHGHEVSEPASASRAVQEIRRDCQLEDIHIVRTAEGDSTGRLVEAYAAVFDQPAVIRDHQGHYEEEIDRAAFDERLAQIQRSRRSLASALRVLYNHGRTAEGDPAPEFQKPLGKPVDVRPEGRGLLTRTEYAKTPHAEEVLELIRAGAITAQSFVGAIIRSDPELRGPGDKYRARNGVLTRVRRQVLGLREYGPVLWEAYSGAEILGVRMALPGAPEDFDSPLDEEYDPDKEAVVAGSVPEDTTTARYHQHALYALRSRELREKVGLVW